MARAAWRGGGCHQIVAHHGATRRHRAGPGGEGRRHAAHPRFRGRLHRRRADLLRGAPAVGPREGFLYWLITFECAVHWVQIGPPLVRRQGGQEETK